LDRDGNERSLVAVVRTKHKGDPFKVDVRVVKVKPEVAVARELEAARTTGAQVGTKTVTGEECVKDTWFYHDSLIRGKSVAGN
jgi:hypothetical protein